jgi:hypothetical protein
MADCIVPWGNVIRRQPEGPVQGRPPPWPRDYARMMHPGNTLDLIEGGLEGLGGNMQYIDVSKLNRREANLVLSGLGGGGSGTLGGNVLGAFGLGAAPAAVCKYLEYECQYWDQLTPEQKAQATQYANDAAKSTEPGMAQAKAQSNEIMQGAVAAGEQSIGESQYAMERAQLAYKAAENCDIPEMMNQAGASDQHHQNALAMLEVAAELATDAADIAGKMPSDPVVVQNAEYASQAAYAAAHAEDLNEDARLGIIADAKALAQTKCGAKKEEVEPPPTTTKKKGVQRAGLLWLGIAGLVAAGLYAVAKKKK